MGDEYSQPGQYDESLKWYYEALLGSEALLRNGSVQTLATIIEIARAFRKQDRFVEAIFWYKKALDSLRDVCRAQDTPLPSVENEVRILLHLYQLCI